jgi:hypothetical protein
VGLLIGNNGGRTVAVLRLGDSRYCLLGNLKVGVKGFHGCTFFAWVCWRLGIARPAASGVSGGVAQRRSGLGAERLGAAWVAASRRRGAAAAEWRRRSGSREAARNRARARGREAEKIADVWGREI